MSSKKVSRKDANAQSREEESMSKKPKNLGDSASLREPGKHDDKSTLVPKLRFPEFRAAEGWEQKEIGEVFQVTRGDVLSMTLVRDEKTEAMPYPVYSSQTKNNGLSGYYSDYLFEDAITWTTDGANAGDVNYRSGKFYCTNVCGVLLNSKGFANPCIAALINAVSRKYVSYVGNPKLMNGVMSKIPIPFPSIAEQQKIAECLSSVDELMAAQARKVDALKTHKKGLMQQLFPREGETQPRLRFPEFQNAGEWEVKPLGTAAKNLDNRRRPITSSDREAGDVPYYGASGIVDYVEGCIFDEDLLCVSEDGANLVARTYPIAFPISGKTWVNNHAHVLRFTNPCTQKFVEVYLNSIKLDDFITGMAQPKLNKAMLDKIPIPYPEVPEQQRIADCLSSLDDLIAAQTQKLEALKTHKQGLMQQLFPSPEEVT
ncbi:MAG: restriction endonuclease subunit S [Pirellulaceae bacterium]|nr:restriction endonuclease subunit S [Pirellulaceae bacterium]